MYLAQSKLKLTKFCKEQSTNTLSVMKNLRTCTILALKCLRGHPHQNQPPPGSKNIKPETPQPINYTDMRLYKAKTNYDLLNLITMNTLCSSDLFVDHCDRLYTLSNTLLGMLK